MKIVIDISEETYNSIKNGMRNRDDMEEVGQAVEDGTPLPKGHGRLIDADELKKIIKENDSFVRAGFSVRLIDIDSTPTIIEADKEGE